VRFKCRIKEGCLIFNKVIGFVIYPTFFIFPYFKKSLANYVYYSYNILIIEERRPPAEFYDIDD